MKFCSNCGTKLNPGAAFCPHCGVKVERVKTAARAFEITPQFWLGFYLTLIGGVAAGIAYNVDTLTTLVPSTIMNPAMTGLIIIACVAIPGIFTLITGIMRGFNHRQTSIGTTVVGMAILLVAGSIASMLFVGENGTSSPALIFSLVFYFIAIVTLILAYFVTIFVTAEPATSKQARHLHWAIIGMTVVAVLVLAALAGFLIAVIVLVGVPFLGRRFSLDGGRDWRLLTREHGNKLSWRFYLVLLVLAGCCGLCMTKIYLAAGLILSSLLVMAAEWWSNPLRLGKQQREMAGCLLVVALLLQGIYLSFGSRMGNAWPIMIAIFILMGAALFTYFYVMLRTRFVINEREDKAE
ncbi:MAG: zinc ribbon domain-containing protein [Limosilactobacillus oris]